MKRFLVALACVFCLPLAAAAIPLGSAEVARLVQDSPPLEEYKGEHAVIWRRNLTYSKDSDGRTVCSTSVAVLCDAAARLEWLTDQLYAPDGGRIELEQAAFFDPGTAKLLHNLTFSAAERDHYGRIVLDVPKMDDVYLFVLSYRQYFAEKDNLEGLVWLGAEYPVWEGSVQVRLPKGEELLYQSSSNSAPTKRDDSRFSWYSWYYFKQPANRGIVGILDSSDSYVVFSQRKGFLSTLNALKSMASRRWSGIPARYAVSKGSVKERALKTIESFWFSPSRLPVSGVWRSPSMIPSDGPWTTWEAYYVAAAWLKSQGW
ncbi:MAG: hypothetical protein SOZ52_00580, partial [Pyramidobacter sp.]|nr:hypothetical protein [Pyramidobacter sp.]